MVGARSQIGTGKREFTDESLTPFPLRTPIPKDDFKRHHQGRLSRRDVISTVLSHNTFDSSQTKAAEIR